MGNTASDRKNARCYSLKFSRNTDAELIEWLDSKGSIQGYLKDLIRADMMKEEQNMNTWFIVDDATRSNGLLESYPTHTDDMQKAIVKAWQSWNHLTANEQKHRDDFYIALGRADEDGILDWNCIEETISFKSQYHIKPDFLQLWGEDVDEKTVIDLAEVVNMSTIWDKPVAELLSQLEEI